jgi:hypothetical protein
LYDTLGTLVAAFTTGNDQTFVTPVAAAGAYYLGIEPGAYYQYDSAAVNQYKVTVGSTVGATSGYEVEANNSIASATALPLSAPVIGQLTSNSDVDYFRVSLAGTSTLSIAVDVPTSSSLEMYSLKLRNPSGALIASYVTGKDGVFEVSTLATGNYYLSIEPSTHYQNESSAVNQYKLVVSATHINSSPTGKVTIDGANTQGQTLTASNNLADLDGLGTISYQWKVNGIAVSGATSNTFTLTEAQVGKTLSVTASYTDGFSTAESVASSSTATVANVNDAPTGTVSITGNTSLGQVLTAANTLADLDGLGTISYQWSADSTAIAGATSSTLTLTDAQIGKAITVTASYTDGHGTAESLNSSATPLVTNVPPQTITGTAGNDPALTGGQGNDTINGLAGLDTAVYASRMAAYTTAPTSISGPDGSDTLASIERLQFADANLAFDLDGNAGQTYRLYQASFNRTPDLAGLGGWIAAMDSGTTPVQVASSFMASDEFKSLYGASTTNAQFVSLLYANALHRSADAGGLAGWVDELASGRQTRAQVLINFSESGENKASVLPAITNGIVYATATQAAGPAKGQAFAGTTGADSLIGSVGNDTLTTSAGNDTINAGFGNDSITGGTGNDTINGGGGLDTAIFSGNRATYTTANVNATLTVSGGTDGTDTLTNVERLKFDDAILAFDASGNAGQTYRLYQAAFNRTPDKGGLTGWVNGVDSGMTMLKVAAAFIESGEFKALYGASPTDAEFVNLLYTNALHRTPDQGGLDYWVNQLSSNSQTREQALLGFSESVENQASLIGVIQGGIELAI